MKKIIFILLITLLAGTLGGCKNPQADVPISKTGIFFDTVIKIELYNADESLLTKAFDLCRTYEEKFSKTIPTSEVSKINAAGGAFVSVSDETIALIKKGIYYGDLSKGAFDITIAPLSELWNFQNKEVQGKTVPDESEINEALRHVNYQSIVIDGNKVSLNDAEAQLDLGGIAKGYIADRLKYFLVENGVANGLINLGGNVLAIGQKPDGTPFQIGVQKPFDKQGRAITSVAATDISIVSSGVYERYFEADGTRYHHILNPDTGYPFANDLLGVTILSEDSTDGDALSTTCFALGLEKGMELLKQLNGVEGLFITTDYQIHDSRKQ